MDNKCDCDVGWKGSQCQWCEGRMRLSSNSGVITSGAGNYSTENQCMWLIDAGQPNTLIRLHLQHFATECSWDSLYIYDGDSIYDPLLAAFSGMVVQDDYQVPYIPEVVAKSGYALLYFYSDAAYSLSGFSISYSHHRVDDCPSTVVGEECSSRGACLEGMCICDMGWRGPACSVPVCPGGCSGNGQCKPEERRCQCHQGYTGTDCSQVIQEGWWEVVSPDITSKLINPVPISSGLERGSHATVLINNAIWVIGGYSFTEKPFVLRYNITEDTWRALESRSIKKPASRYGHSAVVYNGSIYMYGGMKEDGTITREFWQLDTSSLAWSLVPMEKSSRGGENRQENISSQREGREGDEDEFGEEDGEANDHSPKRENGSEAGGCLSSSPGPSAPIPCVGHAAVVVQKVKKNVMLVIFGHSSRYGYLNTVQEFDFEQGNWETIDTRGAVVSGVYGHTAVWDPVTSLVYVHGGLHSVTSTSQVVPYLMTYDPVKHIWRLQTPAPVPRFLHSAILFKGLMLVFGGNTHNDTAYSYGAKCYSADFLAYDISCNSWHAMRKPPNLYLDVARYGHTAVFHQDEMYIVGGFNSKMLGSVLKYHPGDCETGLTSSEKCLTSYPGVKCVWNRILTRCESIDLKDEITYDVCPAVTAEHNFTVLCNSQTSCHSCVSNTYNCSWCSSSCTDNRCTEYTKGVVKEEGCEEGLRSRCKGLSTCPLCQAHQHCDWVENQCVPAPNRTITTALTNGPAREANPNLGSENTLQTVQIDKDMAIGTEATLLSHKPCQPICAQRTSCTNCTQSSCIWCFNQQRCIENNSYLVSFPYGQCREWTTDSKRCMDVEPGMSRCSIHQTCEKCQADVACGWCDDGSGTGIGTCMEGGQRGPVNLVTKARQWKKCPRSNWYFTQCPSCMCNEHGDTCNRETGRCNCHTKGVTGDHCDQCDTQNNYFGEPLKGSCFYDLHIDYQFTFNLSKPEDRHIRQINFMNVPAKSDVDTSFKIQCSKATNIKISYKRTNSHETWIIRNFNGKRMERKFSSSDYTFGFPDNNRFHVYVYNFTTPIEIIVSFSQHPKLSLGEFFSLFSL